jgi:hypothetical protein
MSLTLRASLLALWLSLSANAQTRTLALYAGPARGLDVEAAAVMRAELQRLLAPAGIDVVWKSLAFRKAGENFDLVAVGSFEGSCATDNSAVQESAASLADTSIADGHILPFFRVDCTRLIRMLGTQSEPPIIGRALARLVGHEIYHIVAQTTEHQEKGLAKGSFSIRDLTANPFDLDASSLQRMLASLMPRQTSSFLSPLR